jgi:hypothetical protein
MTNRGPTQGERLMRIEVLLEGIATRLDKIEEHQSKQDEDARLDKADLERIKNRGWGLIIGVGLAAGGLGASIAEFFKS